MSHLLCTLGRGDRATFPHPLPNNGSGSLGWHACPPMRARRANSRQLHPLRSRQRRARSRGTASIELLICLMPVLLTFLAIVQYSLLYIGQLVVQHSATRAVRAAVVLLDDAPKHHGGAARRDLAGGKSSGAGPLPSLTSLRPPPSEDAAAGEGANSGEEETELTAENAQLSQNPTGSALIANLNSAEKEDEKTGPRLTAIRRAAYMPLAVLAPPLSALDKSTVGDAVSFSKLQQLGLGLLLYGRAAAAITLHKHEDEDPAMSFNERDRVIARVKFLMPCRVPLVSRMMCKTGPELKLNGDLKGFEHVASKSLHNLVLLSGLRFMVLEGRAAGVNHGAHYYQPEQDES